MVLVSKYVWEWQEYGLYPRYCKTSGYNPDYSGTWSLFFTQLWPSTDWIELILLTSGVPAIPALFTIDIVDILIHPELPYWGSNYLGP